MHSQRGSVFIAAFLQSGCVEFRRERIWTGRRDAAWGFILRGRVLDAFKKREGGKKKTKKRTRGAQRDERLL